jgi:ComF family protein
MLGGRMLKPKCWHCYAERKRFDLMLCDMCLDQLPWLTQSLCQLCGLPSCASVCTQCQQSPLSEKGLFAPLRYTDPIKSWLANFKYCEHLLLGDMLAKIFCFAWRHSSLLELPEAIIPIPLHTKKIKKRGFNQTVFMANIIAKHLPCRVLPSALMRSKHGPSQSSLTLLQRKKNVQGIFECVADQMPQRVAIFDDVMTTGYTIQAAKTCLQAAGVTDIQCWSIARCLDLVSIRQ